VPWQRLIRDVSGAFLSVFLPGECRLCKGLLTHGSRLPICEECLTSFPLIPAKICQLCGQPYPATEPGAEETSVCASCQQQKYHLEVARSFGEYDGPLARAIVLLKFERIAPLGEWFASRLAEVVRANRDCLQADVVVPVPLHRQTLKERGFNQVELFARPLAKRLGLPFRPILLMRTRPRPERHLLNYEER
jgi:predicted amidophosphoribosyltransferase